MRGTRADDSPPSTHCLDAHLPNGNDWHNGGDSLVTYILPEHDSATSSGRVNELATTTGMHAQRAKILRARVIIPPLELPERQRRGRVIEQSVSHRKKVKLR